MQNLPACALCRTNLRPSVTKTPLRYSRPSIVRQVRAIPTYRALSRASCRCPGTSSDSPVIASCETPLAGCLSTPDPLLVRKLPDQTLLVVSNHHRLIRRLPGTHRHPSISALRFG